MARMARMAHQQTFTFSHCQGTKATMMTTKLCKTSVSPDRLAPCFSFQKGSPESPLSWKSYLKYHYSSRLLQHTHGTMLARGSSAYAVGIQEKDTLAVFVQNKACRSWRRRWQLSRSTLHIFSCMPLKHVLHFVSSQYLQPAAARWFRQWYGWNVWIRKPCWKSRRTNTRVRSNTTFLNLFHWMQSLLSQRTLK